MAKQEVTWDFDEMVENDKVTCNEQIIICNYKYPLSKLPGNETVMLIIDSWYKYFSIHLYRSLLPFLYTHILISMIITDLMGLTTLHFLKSNHSIQFR